MHPLRSCRFHCPRPPEISSRRGPFRKRRHRSPVPEPLDRRDDPFDWPARALRAAPGRPLGTPTERDPSCASAPGDRTSERVLSPQDPRTEDQIGVAGGVIRVEVRQEGDGKPRGIESLDSRSAGRSGSPSGPRRIGVWRPRSKQDDLRPRAGVVGHEEAPFAGQSIRVAACEHPLPAPPRQLISYGPRRTTPSIEMSLSV